MVSAYRQHGHKVASINPIALSLPEDLPELKISSYGLELNHHVNFNGIISHRDKSYGTLQEAVQFLQETYCGHVSAEFTHLSEEEKEWFAEKMENCEEETADKKKKLMEELVKSQVFDNFLATKFSSLKRYGGEGAEAMMAFFTQILEGCERHGVTNLVVGMPHRGRMNLLTGMFQVPPALVFR